MLVFAVWLAMSYSPGAWMTARGFAAAFVVLLRAGADRSPRVSTGAVRRAGGMGRSTRRRSLLFVFAVIARIEPAADAPVEPVRAAVRAAGAVAWRAIATGEFGLYFIAAFFGLAAEASWSATFLDRRIVCAPRSSCMPRSALFYVSACRSIARRIGRAIRAGVGRLARC